MMSKVTTLLCALLLAIGVAGCGDSGKGPAAANKPAEKPAAAPTAAPAAPAEAGKKVEEAKKPEGTEKPK